VRNAVHEREKRSTAARYCRTGTADKPIRTVGSRTHMRRGSVRPPDQDRVGQGGGSIEA
jgi:hypothetical protein